MTQTLVEDINTKAKISGASSLRPEDFCSPWDAPEGMMLDDVTFRRLLDAPPIIMHGGAFFGIRPTRFENAFTQRSLSTTSHEESDDVEHYPKADLEARALAAVYRLHGHPVIFMLPQPDSIDGIFCTDSDKTFQAVRPVSTDQEIKWRFDNTVSLLPVFTHELRQIEVEWKERFFRSALANPNPKGRRHILNMHHPLEFGDTRIVFHKTSGKSTGFVLAGIAETNEVAMGRSTKAGHEEMEGYLKQYVDPAIEVVTIHLKQPFYHMDTSGPTCTGGHMFTHSSAYTPESWDVLKQIFRDKLIELPFEDIGRAFGGNATCFGRRIYISNAISERAISMLNEHGYDVILTPIPHTMMGGGGHRCMTSVNPHYYIPGGYDLDFDANRSGSLQVINIDYEAGRITISNRNASGKLTNETEIQQLVTEFEELRDL